MYWERIAYDLEKTKHKVDWEGRSFECPVCGNHIYETDWKEKDYIGSNLFQGELYCPKCSALLWED